MCSLAMRAGAPWPRPVDPPPGGNTHPASLSAPDPCQRTHSKARAADAAVHVYQRTIRAHVEGGGGRCAPAARKTASAPLRSKRAPRAAFFASSYAGGWGRSPEADVGRDQEARTRSPRGAWPSEPIDGSAPFIPGATCDCEKRVHDPGAIGSREAFARRWRRDARPLCRDGQHGEGVREEGRVAVRSGRSRPRRLRRRWDYLSHEHLHRIQPEYLGS